MNICCFPFRPGPAISPLKHLKQTLIARVAIASVMVLGFMALSIPLIHHYITRSAFYYGGIGGVSLLSLSLLAMTIKYAIVDWKAAHESVQQQQKEWEVYQSDLKQQKDSQLQPSVKILGCYGFKKEERKENSIAKPVTASEEDKFEKFLEFPNDIVNIILQNLDLKDLCSMEQTCQRICSLLKNENFWKFLILRNFGQMHVPEKGFRKEYRILYSLKNGIFQTYSQVSSHALFTFNFNNKLHFIREGYLIDGKDRVIAGHYEKYEEVDDLYILATKLDGIVDVYDANYKFKCTLDFSVQHLNREDENFDSLFGYFRNKNFYFFDKKTLECVHHLNLDEGPNRVTVTIGNDNFFVFLKRGELVSYDSSFKENGHYCDDRMEILEWHSLVNGENVFVFQSKKFKEISLFSEKDLKKPCFSISYTSDSVRSAIMQNFLYVLDSNIFQAWDISARECVSEIQLNNSNCFGYVLRHFLIAKNGGELQVFDIQNRKYLYSLSIFNGDLTKLNGSLNDKLIFSTRLRNYNHNKLEIVSFGNFPEEESIVSAIS